MIQNIDLLIFDLDGTLIDSKEDIALSVNYTLSHYQAPPFDTDYLYNAIASGVYKLLIHALSDLEISSEEIINTFRNYYLQHLLDNTVCYPQAHEVLEHFKDKSIALLTNKPDEYTIPILEGLNIINYFQIIECGDNHNKPKPHPETIEKLMRILGTPSNKTIIIGDTDVDIQAGVNAGIKSCWAAYGYGRLDKIIPDIQINTLADLIKMIQ